MAGLSVLSKAVPLLNEWGCRRCTKSNNSAVIAQWSQALKVMQEANDALSKLLVDHQLH